MTIYTGTGSADLLIGAATNDTLYGLGGNDILNGLAGVDTLVGGTGDDTYYVEINTDAVIEAAGEGTDLVYADSSTLAYTLTSNVENLVLTGTGNSWGTGNTLNNVLTGNSGNNLLNGGAGNDILNGLAGVDTLIGGTGDDTYFIESNTDIVAESAGEGIDVVCVDTSALTYTLTANVENLLLLGTGSSWGTGNTLNNVLIGNSGNNLLNGGDGNDTLNGSTGVDTLIGGTGDDTYYIEINTDIVAESAGEGTDVVYADTSTLAYTLTANVENLVLTGAGNSWGGGNTLNNLLIGNSGDNMLIGDAGDDIIDGSAGADALFGGTGNDTFYVDNVGDVVTEYASEGTDTLISSISATTLGANVENLILGGTGSSSGSGNALNNVITGNSGDNTLFGDDGNDTLYGMDGNDIIDGGNGADTLYGGNGNDTLNGSAGVDALFGGAGDDTYVIDNSGDTIAENAGEGTDWVQSSVSYTLGADVERLSLTGGGAINGTGNAAANYLYGNGSANVLDGGAGGDWMLGGQGNDTYYMDNATDVSFEFANAGIDTVISSVTRTLLGNVENLILTGAAALNGTGNVLNNEITGNSGDNTLDGSDGNDILDGGDGADLLIGGLGTDTVSYASASGSVQVMLDDGSGSGFAYLNEADGDILQGFENLRGSSFEDQLLGSAGANTLWGGDGGDILDGLGGADLIDGGAGGDIVSYLNSGAGVSVNLNGSVGTGGDAAGDVLLNIESINGSDFNDTLVGSAAANALIGFDGDDTIQGLGGSDYLMGNAGSDTVSYAGLGQGVQVVLQWNGVLDDGYGFYGSETDTLASFENIVGTDYDDVFYGSEASNTLVGGAGSDTMVAGDGADRLVGGSGDDYYYFQRDHDQDVIVENDSSSNTDKLQLTNGIDSDQVWFRHVGNDLEVSIIGTADKITITDWYSGSARHVEQFLADDGKVLLDSQVDNLVSAMSAFSPPSSGQTTLPPTYQTALATVIAANWQ